MYVHDQRVLDYLEKNIKESTKMAISSAMKACGILTKDAQESIIISELLRIADLRDKHLNDLCLSTLNRAADEAFYMGYKSRDRLRNYLENEFTKSKDETSSRKRKFLYGIKDSPEAVNIEDLDFYSGLLYDNAEDLLGRCLAVIHKEDHKLRSFANFKYEENKHRSIMEEYKKIPELVERNKFPKIYGNLSRPIQDLSEKTKSLLFGGLILIGFLSAILLIAGLVG